MHGGQNTVRSGMFSIRRFFCRKVKQKGYMIKWIKFGWLKNHAQCRKLARSITKHI